MARELLFSNSRLFVGLDNYGFVGDLYYPYVGLESHIAPDGPTHKVGIFHNGQMSWLDDGSWSFNFSYHNDCLVGQTVATHEAWGLRLEFTDCVASAYDAFIRSIHVINTSGGSFSGTLYCYQAFQLNTGASSDTAQYRPDLQGVLHYKGNRSFVAALNHVDQYSVGHYDCDGSGSFHDAEDGQLSGNVVENGRVDSVLGVDFTLAPHDSTRMSYWLAAGETLADAEAICVTLAENGIGSGLVQTAKRWKIWLEHAVIDQDLPENYQLALKTALLMVKAHQDERGAVMASLDGSLRNHPEHDTYNFCWGRDSTYALWPLLRLGYTDELLAFFEFIKRTIHEDGFLLHKYRADGSAGSSWLPYVHPDGSVGIPIQADETASVLYLLGQYYRHTADQKFVVDFYEALVEPMANFLAQSTDHTGLPLPSYDLWEHGFSTHTYTAAVTYGALIEACELADIYGRNSDGVRWRAAAEAMQSAARQLYGVELQYFYKGITDGTGNPTLDMSSLYGVFMYNLFPLDGQEIAAASQTAQQRLKEPDGVLYGRFEKDDYYGDQQSPNVWLITSLWMAQIFLEKDEKAKAQQIVDAVLACSSQAGLLPEQVTAGAHDAVSVRPLVWSHAELANTLIDYMQTDKEIV